MKRFGIFANDALGISVPEPRSLSKKKIGKNRELSLELWGTGIHEARLLASMVEESEQVTAE